MFRRVKNFIQKLPRKVKIGAPIVIIVLLFFLNTFSGEQGAVAEEPVVPAVTVAAAGSLAPDMTNTFTGTVVSANNATLRAESQGQVIGVYKKRGDIVSRGILIAQIENSRELASVTQARASLKVAEANLAKLSNESTQGRTRSLELSTQEAKRNLDSALQDAIIETNTIYADIDSALLSYIDPLFDTPRGPNPWFMYPTELGSGSLRDRLNKYKRQVYLDQMNWERELREALTAEQKIQITHTYLVRIKPLFDTYVEASTDLDISDTLSATQIADIKSKAVSARDVLLSAISEAKNLQDTIDTYKNALRQAQTNEDIGVAGTQDEDIAIAEAQVEQARASLQTAQVAYEKTLIRAPISGTITALSIEVGDVLSPLSEIGTISSTGNLEISIHVSEEDARKLNVGNEASINGEANGHIQEIAPALDPITQKREVIIKGISGSSLTSGEVVSVRLSGLGSTTSTVVYLPLSSLKVTPEETVVFSVKEDMTLEALTIEIDSISGEYALISSGISPDTLIITDARGRREGETVRTN